MNRLPVLAASLALLILAGCGGSGADIDQTGGPLPLSEGSIPIGIAGSTTSSTTRVKVTANGGQSVTVAPDFRGTVWIPSNFPGAEWRIEAESPDAYTTTFTVKPKGKKVKFFDVDLLPRERKGDLSGILLGPIPKRIKVGDRVKLKATFIGKKPAGLVPSFWTSGGVGTINTKGEWTATHTGVGTITAGAFDLTDTEYVWVEPK